MMNIPYFPFVICAGILVLCWIHFNLLCAAAPAKHPVPKEHPRLPGSRHRLQRLASERTEAYQRMVEVARELEADDHAKMLSMALVCAIEQDEQLGKSAVQMAMKYITGPIRQGHVTFGHDLARCAIVYDLCYEYWTPGQRANEAPHFTCSWLMLKISAKC